MLTINRIRRNNLLDMIKVFYQAQVLTCLISILLVLNSVQSVSAQIGQSEIEKTQAILQIIAIEDEVSPDNEFLKPQDGNKFIAIQILFDNKNGNSIIKSNPLFFKLKDTEGNEYTVELMGAKNPALGASDVEAGDIVKGWLTFQVTEDIDIETLKLRYISFSQKSGWINLSGEVTSPQEVTEEPAIKTEDTAGSAQSMIEGIGTMIKIVNIEDDATSDNEFLKPQDGNKFVVIQVIVDNTNGKEKVTANPLFFKIKDSEGNEYSVDLMGIKNPALGSSELETGDMVKGWLTFQVSEDIDIETLRLRYVSFSKKSGWINLADAE